MAEPIRIGVSLPQSGRDARGVGVALQRLPTVGRRRQWAWGLLGRPVDLVVYDDGSIP